MTVLFLSLKTMSTSYVITQCKKDADFSPQCDTLMLVVICMCRLGYLCYNLVVV